MIELPYFGLYDVLFGVALFCIFALVLLLGLLASGAIKWIIISVAIILFFALPFLNILLLDNLIRKATFIDDGSKKLVYIDSFLLRGILQNSGQVALKKCDFNIYIKSTYPLKPDYIITIDDLHLQVGNKIEVEKSIDNFGDEAIKRIKIRCF